MSTKKNIRKHTLNLLVLKGNLFPENEADFDLLKRRHVPIYRIPLASLPQLKSTALTQLNIELKPFAEMWDVFATKFEANLNEYCVSVKKVNAHEFWAKIALVDAKHLDKLFAEIERYVQRYCIRLALDIQKGEEFVRYKMRFIYSEDINNSYAFRNINNVGESTTLNLTSCLRLVFTNMIVDGVPNFMVQAQDLHGDAWIPSLHRSVPSGGMSKDQLAEMGAYFLNLS